MALRPEKESLETAIRLEIVCLVWPQTYLYVSPMPFLVVPIFFVPNSTSSIPSTSWCRSKTICARSLMKIRCCAPFKPFVSRDCNSWKNEGTWTYTRVSKSFSAHATCSRPIGTFELVYLFTHREFYSPQRQSRSNFDSQDWSIQMAEDGSRMWCHWRQ